MSPIDVYMSRQGEILQRRAEKKRLTLSRRKIYNMRYKKDGERLQEVYVKKSAKCTISPET